MTVMFAYIVGVFTLPLIFALAWCIAVAWETGTEVECRACGYCTGPMNDTHRIVCWARWHWHKLTTGHHTRRWLRAQGQS